MSEPMEPEPQPQVEPVAMAEELQASIAEDFTCLLSRITMIQKRQDAKIESLLDVLKADAYLAKASCPAAASDGAAGIVDMASVAPDSPNRLDNERLRSLSRLFEVSSPGEDRQLSLSDMDNDSNDQIQDPVPTSISNRALPRIATQDSMFSWDRRLAQLWRPDTMEFDSMARPSSISSSSVRSEVSRRKELARGAATRAIGKTEGFLHTHIPAERVTSSGMLGNAQRLYIQWNEQWKNEPKRQGCLARFVDGKLNWACIFVILTNAVVMAQMADKEMANPKHKLPLVFTILEVFFILAYLIEQILKLSVHRLFHLFGPGAAWNWFDMFVLTSSIILLAPGGKGVAVTSLRSMRVLKVGKFLRLLRIFRIFTPLRHMLTALMASVVPLTWSLIMLAFLMYTFALFLMQICCARLAEDDVLPRSPLWVEIQTHFGSVVQTMYTLFAVLTGGDWTEQFASVSEVGRVGRMAFLFYIAFFNVAVMNIVTGMFVNAAMKLGQPDTDEQATEKLQDCMTNLQELRAIANEIDSDGSGFLTPDELREFIQNPLARARLAVLGVDAKDANSFVSLLSAASDDGPISVSDFVNGCCRMSGNASSIDLQCHTFHVELLMKKISQALSSQEQVQWTVPQAGEGELKDGVHQPRQKKEFLMRAGEQVDPRLCDEKLQLDGPPKLQSL